MSLSVLEYGRYVLDETEYLMAQVNGAKEEG